MLNRLGCPALWADRTSADSFRPPGMAGVAFDPTNCKSLYIGNLHPYVNEQMLQVRLATPALLLLLQHASQQPEVGQSLRSNLAG